jgi:hypothetical protein
VGEEHVSKYYIETDELWPWFTVRRCGDDNPVGTEIPDHVVAVLNTAEDAFRAAQNLIRQYRDGEIT